MLEVITTKKNQNKMRKLNNEYLSLAIGTSIAEFGKVDVVFVKAFLMGHIIGKYDRDITEKEMKFINSLRDKSVPL